MRADNEAQKHIVYMVHAEALLTQECARMADTIDELASALDGLMRYIGAYDGSDKVMDDNHPETIARKALNRYRG